VERTELLLRLRRRVVVDVLVVDSRVIDPRPGRLGHGQPAAVSLKPPLEHPGRLVPPGGNKTDELFPQTPLGPLRFDERLKPISVLIDVDPAHPVDRLLYGWHSILRSRFQGPRWTSLERLLRCFDEEITCLEPFKQCFVAPLK